LFDTSCGHFREWQGLTFLLFFQNTRHFTPNYQPSKLRICGAYFMLPLTGEGVAVFSSTGPVNKPVNWKNCSTLSIKHIMTYLMDVYGLFFKNMIVD
jgi:hypothetical protein